MPTLEETVKSLSDEHLILAAEHECRVVSAGKTKWILNYLAHWQAYIALAKEVKKRFPGDRRVGSSLCEGVPDGPP
jgi:hypothetical protein